MRAVSPGDASVSVGTSSTSASWTLTSTTSRWTRSGAASWRPSASSRASSQVGQPSPLGRIRRPVPGRVYSVSWTGPLSRSAKCSRICRLTWSFRIAMNLLAYRDCVLRIGLVADDLTGACDSALPFLAAGPVRVGLWPHVPRGELACAAISTESRIETAEVSYARSREAAGGLRCDLLFRKLDSLLRGSPAAELAGVLDATGQPQARCVVAPALPAEGRFTVGGVQRWPGGEADLAALLAPVAGRIEIRDAATDAELDRVAVELVARGDRVVAGTAGLASALARALGLGPLPTPPGPACARPLAVVGSPAAAGQAAFAAARGWDVQVLGPGAAPDL